MKIDTGLPIAIFMIIYGIYFFVSVFKALFKGIMMDTLMKDQAMKTRYGIALKDGVNKTRVLAYSEECNEKYGFKKPILDENADDPIFFIVTSNHLYRANSNYIGFATPDSAQRGLDSLEDRFRELLEVREVCAKGGGVCDCKKCFRTKPADVD